MHLRRYGESFRPRRESLHSIIDNLGQLVTGKTTLLAVNTDLLMSAETGDRMIDAIDSPDMVVTAALRSIVEEKVAQS